MALTMRSVWRTESAWSATRFAALSCCRPSSARSARACPISSFPSKTSACTAFSKFSNLSKLVVAARERPMASAASFLERIEVFPLDVLDQRHGECRRIRHVADERRDLGETGDFRRAPAPLACDDLVAVVSDRPHENRLHQALRPDRSGELLQRAVVHLRARLVAAALQLIDAQRGLPLGDRPRLPILVE